MKKVTSLVGDMLMEQAVLLYHLLIVFGPLLHPAELALDLAELVLGLPQPAGRIGCGTVVCHIEAGDRIVQSHGGFLRRRDRLRRADRAGVEKIAVILVRAGALHCDPG